MFRKEELILRRKLLS